MIFSAEGLLPQPKSQPEPTKAPEDAPWIGVDLDGTLASYDKFRGWNVIGEPVPKMVERIKLWRSLGIEVKILTARASVKSCAINSISPDQMKQVITKWCQDKLGFPLDVVTEKDAYMMFFVDDSAVQVEASKGDPIGGDAAFEKFKERILENIPDSIPKEQYANKPLW